MKRVHDALPAVAILAIATAELIGSRGRDLPLAVDWLLLVLMVSPLLWRRRWPLESSCVALAVGFVLIVAVPDIRALNSVLFLLLVPPYTVAAHEPHRRALIGLAACLAGPVVLNAATDQGVGSWLFALGMTGGAWAAGRMLRSRRRLAADLRRTAERLVAEQDGRERLVVAEVRSRIARELQAVVAARVTAMVVQAKAADRVLDDDPDSACEAIAAIEDTGRQALGEMRQILGVLRADDDGAAELAPQPGVGSVPALIDAAREKGRQVTLEVVGEPGVLPARVDLGVFRIIEDALATAAADRAIAIALRFGAHDIAVEVEPGGGLPPGWPTVAMEERVALCDGELTTEGDARLQVRLPRALVHALA